MSRQKSGIIKHILKDHFDGFSKMNDYRFPKSYRKDMKETVEKAMRCGTRDLGYSRMNVWNAKEILILFSFASPVKVVSAINAVRSIRMIGRINSRK
ncbi:hypothetical protein MUB24_21750 [Lederbergia sp. NSJ-179]|nr:hypothetical protein [Lederbergia sp. NSJ-179]MCJ7843450.1 hypothetical protein [Lederbergia sp. NSJ-179]